MLSKHIFIIFLFLFIPPLVSLSPSFFLLLSLLLECWADSIDWLCDQSTQDEETNPYFLFINWSEFLFFSLIAVQIVEWVPLHWWHLLLLIIFLSQSYNIIKMNYVVFVKRRKIKDEWEPSEFESSSGYRGFFLTMSVK